eukprot:CAMPEP_0170587260 /NCGR_PEP_ID=MMETSP0224-20130122/10190_1 /TAXON_ID=285029 /ORGANISM="Togula jolla, Strain CCCM 725" /LENGTH=68 /DNA_ID=CAMNT_0010910875 /DNA_START=46 /DNA_END=252 /DNA_ORIENTATION=-
MKSSRGSNDDTEHPPGAKGDLKGESAVKRLNQEVGHKLQPGREGHQASQCCKAHIQLASSYAHHSLSK